MNEAIISILAFHTIDKFSNLIFNLEKLKNLNKIKKAIIMILIFLMLFVFQVNTYIESKFNIFA
jgi:hypothetical protein